MNIKDPFVMLLIGPPLSGKTTWIKNNFPNTEVISRDELVMEVAQTRDYNKAFAEVDQKLVDQILQERLLKSAMDEKSVIVDMTNMTIKRRLSTLKYFGDNFYRIAVIFPILSDEEYQIRNQKRISEENKDLPLRIIKRMISSYQPISKEEGFNKIISVNSEL
jgi:predicted kinase